jgi:hypothetical protein
MEEEKNIIDPPDAVAGNMPVNGVTHFSFLHPPGGEVTEVTGLHYTINANGRTLQVYIVQGEVDEVGGMMSGNMALTNSGDSFSALVDQQHIELADIQDHLVRAAAAMSDAFNISQSFLKS